MPLIVPNDNRGRSWDRTPTRYIHTRRYEVLKGPRLDSARAIQSTAFDWALTELEASPHLKIRCSTSRRVNLAERLVQARRALAEQDEEVTPPSALDRNRRRCRGRA